jgi:hypothetical protein
LSRGFRVVVATAALIMCAVVATAATASASASAKVTQIVSPTTNQVVGAGGVQVALRSRAALSKLQIFVDGHPVKRYFHGSGGVYRATLRLGRGLHLGVDDLLVVTGKAVEMDDVSFIVAQRASNLLTVSDLRLGGDAPVSLVARLATGATLQAWVNGHRNDGAFQPGAAGYVGRLGANDWLKPGVNRVVVLAYTTSPSGNYAAYESEVKTFWRRPGQLTAGAGPDLAANAGDFIRLHGSVSDARSGNRGAPRVSYSWTVVGRPSNAAATLYHASTESPGFEANAPGQYLISTKVLAADGASSVDTATVTLRADVPPMGASLESAADDRGTIMFDGKPVEKTTEPCDPTPDPLFCGHLGSYAIFNRQTLELVTSGTFYPHELNDMKRVADLASSYDKAPTYLMVVNFGPVGDDENDLAAGRRLLRTLGAPEMSDDEMDYMLRYAFPKSIIGVPGSPAGSAFVADPDLHRYPYQGRHAANMSGYLRLNPLSTTGNFEFVFSDQVEFNTDVSQKPSHITMQVGDKTYAHDAPTNGSSGFFLVRLNSQTLKLDQDFFYVTNKPDGAQDPAEAKRMADDIAWASAPENKHGQLLLLLQAFGHPKGNSTGWLQAAQAIGNLGGNAQVFAQLNQGFSDEPHPGRYAFVARSGMDVAAATSSQPLTGNAADGRLHGLFGRGRDDQYEPLIADPTGTVNFDLVRIVNRPSPPGGGFPAFSPGESAAETFLGRDPDIIGVCDPAAPTCDVRKAYYERYTGVSWTDIYSRLGSEAAKAACDAPHPGFTPAECNNVRKELQLEIGRRNTVEKYFGPQGLQAPFLGGVQVAALVDVAKIAEKIREAVDPPKPNNAAANALDIISFVARAAGFVGAVYPPAGAIASGISGAFGLAGYLTRQNGSPDLIGPKVTAASVNLGSDLFDRYQRASAYFTTEAKIIMSDWSKMSEVAAAAASNPKWVLGDVATSIESIRLGTQQAIYESLIPVAYPVLYDLGTGISHATDWKCISPSFLFDKNLFQKTDTGAELTWIMTYPPSIGVAHLIAVGARQTTGKLHDAYVPAPPESITGPLFRDPASPKGGIGLYKLDFYSPQHFEVFGEVLQQRSGGDGYGYYSCQSMPDPPGNSG